MPHGYRYRAAAPETSLWEKLDDMVLVFHRLSGLTHILTEPAPAIADVLSDKPLSAEAVVEALNSRFDFTDDSDLADAQLAAEVVSDRLDELWQLGLVERCDDAV